MVFTDDLVINKGRKHTSYDCSGLFHYTTCAFKILGLEESADKEFVVGWVFEKWKQLLVIYLLSLTLAAGNVVQC